MIRISMVQKKTLSFIKFGIGSQYSPEEHGIMTQCCDGCWNKMNENIHTVTSYSS